jgi:hypothetical protein
MGAFLLFLADADAQTITIVVVTNESIDDEAVEIRDDECLCWCEKDRPWVVE